MLHLLTPDLTERLAREPAVLVRVAATEGSVPREAGTWMLVFAQEVAGTIGGGQLEFQPSPLPASAWPAGQGRARSATPWAPAWDSAAAGWCTWPMRRSRRTRRPR